LASQPFLTETPWKTWVIHLIAERFTIGNEQNRSPVHINFLGLLFPANLDLQVKSVSTTGPSTAMGGGTTQRLWAELDTPQGCGNAPPTFSRDTPPVEYASSSWCRGSADRTAAR